MSETLYVVPWDLLIRIPSRFLKKMKVTCEVPLSMRFQLTLTDSSTIHRHLMTAWYLCVLVYACSAPHPRPY
ncbi:hypothetical protein J6590_044193 [Homalodisca vitripennis]|nr:hypothetical protein J6590_044193 [Homalodisca vitripennis]